MSKDGSVTRQTIHEWFELTYAQYLTIPRTKLQSMPENWQKDFTALLDKLDERFSVYPETGCYWVKLRDSKGRFVHDVYADYQRGRRILKNNKS